jgi:hypothetical protein
LFISFECKRWLQAQDLAQELILNTDSDEQLSEDEDISPFVSNIDTDSDNERDRTRRLQTVE